MLQIENQHVATISGMLIPAGVVSEGDDFFN